MVLFYFLFCLCFQQGQRLIFNSQLHMTKIAMMLAYSLPPILFITNLAILLYICHVIMSLKVFY